MNFDLIVLL
jgi:hypothetical protein